MSGGQPAVPDPDAAPVAVGAKRKDNPIGLTSAEAIAARDARAKRRGATRASALAIVPSARVLDEREKLAEQKRQDALWADRQAQAQKCIEEKMRDADLVYSDVRCQSALTLTRHQQAYASNPNRMTRRDLVTLQCAHNDIDTDSIVWNTTKQLATILAPRTIGAYDAALNAVSSGAVALANVDCFLPVHRLGDAWGFNGCDSCGFGRGDGNRDNDAAVPIDRRRKLSLLRLWAGASWTRESRGVLERFFHEVLLPTGLATRYNEACNCRGQTVLDFLLGLNYWYGATSTLALDQATLMVAYFPASRRLNHTREIRANESDEHIDNYGSGVVYTNVYPNAVYLKRELKAQQDERARLDAIAIPTLVILRRRILMHDEEDGTTERAQKDWDNSFGRVSSLSIDILIAHYADL